jgi:2-polyprenyl-3-methyl-5-hydroxy-6-metoxy-1,4-benzoquinol methylase
MGIDGVRRRRVALLFLWMTMLCGPKDRVLVTGFLLPSLESPRTLRLVRQAQKGFGSPSKKGFGAKDSKPKKPTKKAVLSKLQKTYGGTSPQQIAQATQERIESSMESLPPHLQTATQLYQKLHKWDSHVRTLSILQQAQIPHTELDGAERARDELQRIYDKHQISQVDVHNTFQQITWDASADAKAARAVTGDMPVELADRVDRACAIVAEAVGSEGRCLDVGCGFGVLVPFLTKAGRLNASQIHGIDLSPEMIRNAEQLYPGPAWEAVDFLKDFQDDEGFEAVIFCSALHDMPDMEATVEKAWSLVNPTGRMVVLHAQGASHVAKQTRANPVLVPRGLPTAEEWRNSMGLEGANLVVKPANTREGEEREGYLAVVEKQLTI